MKTEAKDITLAALMQGMPNLVTGRELLRFWQNAGFDIDEQGAAYHLEQMRKAQCIKIDEISKEPILDKLITLAH